MSIEASLIHPNTGESVFVDSVFNLEPKEAFDQESIAVSDPLKYFGRFKTFLFTSATSDEILVEPLPGGSIFLTDLIITARQQSNREISVVLSDGTREELIFDSNLNNEPVRFSISFKGRWRGWKDASIRVTSDSTQRYSIGVGYVKTKFAEEYNVWDSLR